MSDDPAMSAAPVNGEGGRLSRRRLLVGFAGSGLAALAVAGCGKKGDPTYPEGTIPGAPRARRDNSKVYPD